MKIYTPSNIPNEYHSCIVFEERAFCDHCGDLYAFDPVFMEDRDTGWCLKCASLIPYFRISKKESFKVLSIAKQLKTKYYKEQLKEVEKMKIEDIVPVK